jgi:SPP1 gp7 family putative phage head morphogenesis protein
VALHRIITRAVHANAGTAARYRRALLSEIAEMVASVEFWLTAQRRSDPPVLAQDATIPVKPYEMPDPPGGEPPSVAMRGELGKIAERWEKRFAEISEKVAASFVSNSFRGTDNAMRQALRDAGWSIEFTMTPAVRDAFEASLAENVGLIRSIPAQYLQQVEGIVMRSYAAGRDLQTMTREIKTLYPKAKNRAILIARDQSNKANAVVQRARQKELGISEAIWMHSHAGKEPRPTHVAMNGKSYKVEKGMYDSAVKNWIFPGEEINCRCTGRSVLPWTPTEKIN